VLHEPELRLADDMLVPDLAAWRRERLSVLSTREYPALAADWVCEVLLPPTERIDRAKKLGSARASAPRVRVARRAAAAND
jgi:hypothetical protein